MTIRIGRNKSRPVAFGTPDPKRPHIRRVLVAFDNDTFADIRQQAIAAHVSFAEQLRTLVEWGMESAT